MRTTDQSAVAAEVVRISRGLFGEPLVREFERAFHDVSALYAGEDARYRPCDTEYHDLQHVLEVTLAMARLMDGYQRALGAEEAPLAPEHFVLGVVAALFHDFGYLRKRTDRSRRYGAEYIATHVLRGAAYLGRYVVDLGLGVRAARAAGKMVHFTGYEKRAAEIRLGPAPMRRLGQMLGTADILAQMADRCYLEKCRDRLYREFVLGRRAGERRGLQPLLPAFGSGDELVRKTPNFYKGALLRLDVDLERAYVYAERHFRGPNHYLEAMRKNIDYVLASGGGGPALRRRPPYTLAPGVEPYPRGPLPGPVTPVAPSPGP